MIKKMCSPLSEGALRSICGKTEAAVDQLQGWQLPSYRTCQSALGQDTEPPH